MPSACAIRLQDRWLVYPELKTASGFLVAGEPYQSLPIDAEPAFLGKAMRFALTRAHETIPNPTDWKAISAPRLAAAGVESEAAFQRQSQLIGITAVGAEVVLTPTRNGGASGDDKGFHHLNERSLSVVDCADLELGEVLYEALSRCL